MYVLATAGHVDHGKSTLVRALTGMEPDRFAEEQRRGMTIDLGFAWTTLPTGEQVAFVDVPGHERFVPTMLAGVGPVPGVLVIVSADEGWRAQTAEHVTVLDSLGVRHGLLVVTRSDLADPAPAMADARDRLARTSLGAVEAVAVSAVTGTGLDDLRRALSRLAASLPDPDPRARVRLFVDRAFSVRGAGTVVTGTLGAGTLNADDRLTLAPSGVEVRVRALQMLGEPATSVSAVARVAVNLRGLAADQVRRGDVLLTPGRWATTRHADVRLAGIDPADLPGDLMLHLGSAAVPARLRPLGDDVARLRLASALPLQPGDTAVLREPASRLATGLTVLDVDPPPLRRRGAAQGRARALGLSTGAPDPVVEVTRRGSETRARLAALGVLALDAPVPAGLTEVGDRLVDPAALLRWREALLVAVDAATARSPLEAGLSQDAARQVAGLADAALLDAVVAGSGGALVTRRGRVLRPGSGPVFTPAVAAALTAVRARLDQDPLDAPEAQELAAAGLTAAILAAADSAGLLRRLHGEVLVHPDVAATVLPVLAALEQPFTLSAARQALGTTRRVAVPLLEHLDATGATLRLDGAVRRVR